MVTLTSLAVFAPLVLFWQQSKNVISSIISFAIKNEKISFYSNLPSDFVAFLVDNSYQIKFGNINYKELTAFSKLKNKMISPFYEIRNRFIFLYKNKFPLIITPINSAEIQITYLSVFDLQKLISAFENWRDNEPKEASKRFYLYSIRGRSLKQSKNSSEPYSTSGSIPSISSGTQSSNSSYYLPINLNRLSVNPPIGKDISDLLAWPPTNKATSKFFLCAEGEKILNDIKNWQSKKDWYDKKSIVWRRGSLLHGKPGTGKSSTILEVAKAVDMPLFIFDLSSMDNEEFSEKLDEYSSASGIILLIEDIENIFEGRENKQRTLASPGLTFDHFINKISGVKSLQNTYLFITTNHIDKLDPALIRPGRIDNIFEIGNLSQEGKKFIAGRMLEDWPELIEKVIDDKEYTAAEFENMCTQLALEAVWKE